MELLWKDLDINRLLAPMQAQIPVSGDIPPPEGRAVTAVVAVQATAEDCACKSTAEGLRARGKLRLELLCEDEEDLFSFSALAEFAYAAEAPAGEVCCAAAVSAPSVRLEGSVLHFTATVELSLLLMSREPVRALCDVRGAGALERLEAPVRACVREVAQRRTLRLREEVAAPGIEAVLCAQGLLEATRVQSTGDGVELSGMLRFCALCKTADGLMPLMREAPFRELLPDVEGPLAAQCVLQELYVRSVGAEFGVLAAEASVELTLYTMREQSCALPLDAYAPGAPFACTHAPLTALRELAPQCFSREIRESLTLPEGMPAAASALFATVQPTLCACAAEAGTLRLEGVLETTVVYAGESGARYVCNAELPFSCSEATEGSDALISLRAVCLPRGQGRTLELVCTLCVCALPYAAETLQSVDGVEERALAPATPGLTICFAGAGETLYDVAKRYNVARAAVRALQSDVAEVLEEGEKILIMR